MVILRTTMKQIDRVSGVHTRTIMFSLLAMFGCTIDDLSPARSLITEPKSIFHQLALNYHQIVLSTAEGFDTVQLEGRALTPLGTIFSDSTQSHSTVTYRLDGNSTAVELSEGGKVKANRTGARVTVIATQTIGHITRVDTAIVNVLDGVPPTPSVASISIKPTTSDSAKTDCSGKYSGNIKVRAFDSQEKPVSHIVPVSYRSSDPTTASINSAGIVTGLRPGVVNIAVDGFYFDRGFRDTLEFTVSEPLFQPVWIRSRSSDIGGSVSVLYSTPGDVTVALGGIVEWLNTTMDSVSIVLTDVVGVHPAIGGDGYVSPAGWAILSSFNNCPARESTNSTMLVPAVPFYVNGVPFFTPISCGGTFAVLFSRVGVYRYRSTSGFSGRIMVQ